MCERWHCARGGTDFYNLWLNSHEDKLLLFPLSIIGETRWRLSDKNMALVDEVLKNAKLGDLGRLSWQCYYHNIMALRGNTWVLDGCQLRFARETGIIKELPDIIEAQIDDKSKGDAIAKTLAIIQVLWLAIQLLLRKKKDLPVTQLEIVTLAFAACSFSTYLVNWSKPKNITTRIYKVADKNPDS